MLHEPMQCPAIEDLPQPDGGRAGWPWTEDSVRSSRSLGRGAGLPRISIVTPSFNQGRFIEETIRSVLLQGYPNLEYFVMDGGSTDGSIKIIGKYARWLEWESGPDRGQSHAINKGWRRSTGDILAWLNSDDVLLPGALHEVAQHWSRNPAVGFLHGITEIVDQEGQPTGRTWGASFELDASLRASENYIAQQSTFISRSAIEKVGSLDETLEMSMDWDLWLRIAAQFEVVFVPAVWSRIRVWDGTKTSIIPRTSGEDHVVIVRKLLQDRNVAIPAATQRAALAAAYWRVARQSYEAADHSGFRAAYLRSVAADPMILRGHAGQMLPVFLLGDGLAKKLSRLKRRLRNLPVTRGTARERS